MDRSTQSLFMLGKIPDILTFILAPPKPSIRPTVAVNSGGVVMATSKTITVEMPACFFSDDNGPIQKIQVIVSEPAGIENTFIEMKLQHSIYWVIVGAKNQTTFFNIVKCCNIP